MQDYPISHTCLGCSRFHVSFFFFFLPDNIRCKCDEGLWWSWTVAAVNCEHKAELVKVVFQCTARKYKHGRWRGNICVETGAGDGTDGLTRPPEAAGREKVWARMCIWASLIQIFSLPEWVHGEVWVIRFLPVQGRHSVPAHEDVGAALDGDHRRARYHLHPHAVVTVHHAVRDLHLRRDQHRQTSLGNVDKENNYKQSTIPYPRDCSVRVIIQEVAGKREGLPMGVDEGQREDPPCRVQQGPAVMKATRAAVSLLLVGHSHAGNLVPSHLGRQVTWCSVLGQVIFLH